MTKVIIEVKNLQNDVDDEIKESIRTKDRETDLKINRFLKLKGIVKEG